MSAIAEHNEIITDDWRGRRYVDTDGYVHVKVPEHPGATTNGWLFEHHLVYCGFLGRPLKRGEVVHHKDHNKQNNDFSNLELMSVSDHTRLHCGNPNHRQPNENNDEQVCACGCEGTLLKFDYRGRPRNYIHGHNRRKNQ